MGTAATGRGGLNRTNEAYAITVIDTIRGRCLRNRPSPDRAKLASKQPKDLHESTCSLVFLTGYLLLLLVASAYRLQ